MVTALADTSVLVDCLRQYAPAKQWVSYQTNLGVSAMVWIELLQGVPNKNAQQLPCVLLQQFEKVDITTVDVEWSIQQLVIHNLSHNIGGIDCLIASAAHRLQIPLYTTNLKHFSPLLGTLAQKPY